MRDVRVAAARDRYPAFLEWLRDSNRITVALDRRDAPARASEAQDARGLRAGPGVQVARRRGTAELEPRWATRPARSACARRLPWIMWPLFDALRAFGEGTADRDRCWTTAVALEFASACERSAAHAGATASTAQAAVVAAGAWTTAIEACHGLSGRAVRGQMLALVAGRRSATRCLDRRGYLVPRADGRTLVGATMEARRLRCRPHPRRSRTLALQPPRRVLPALAQRRAV